jgi:beta-glucanase (GH16 family)
MRFPGLLFIASLAFAQQPDNAANWILTFADEFNGTELDLSKWVPHDPWGQARDRQLQAWAPESVKVSGGQLHLTAERTTKASPVRYDGKDRDYVSGIVTTFGTFAQLYGRFEVRCKVPAGRGLRSVFSLFPIPLNPLPAVDVFEVQGSDSAKVLFANHWGTEQTHRSFGDSFSVPDLSAGFHIVAVEWGPENIVWYVDGKENFRSVDGIPRQPMYLLLDLAVGGSTGSLSARMPDESTSFPASFDIDYIRVYRRK